MKLRIFFCSLAVFFSGTILKAAADSTGMPGDNLDLYAVMDLFKRSSNLEDFEKSLNNPDNKINNLDLNADGETDYIKVIDNSESDAHAIVLQVDINNKESQDVAVIQVEKEGVENAKVQIVGDDDVYGDNYVVEPYENYVSKDEYDAQHPEQQRVQKTVIVNVWTWPTVTYIYGPVYRPWRSPWYWSHYPGYWRPWRPHPWHVYHGHVWHYHGHGYYYRPAPYCYTNNAGYVYRSHRTSSSVYRRSANIETRSARYNDNRRKNGGYNNTVRNDNHSRHQANPNHGGRGNGRMDRQRNNGNGDVSPGHNRSRHQANQNNGGRDNGRMDHQRNNGNGHSNVSPGANRPQRQPRNSGGGRSTPKPQGGRSKHK